MEVRAVTKYTGISAQKARLVVNEVRGRQAEEALAMLQFMPQSAAKVVAKTIKSALANAEENFGLEPEDMYVAKIVADEAPTRKWRRFGARGRFKPWLRRSSHITVVLAEREIA
ncbi:MAG: 50S ribosomal protein L22 [Caldilineaceae bacterium]|nr:50S ribosomal protein L22 [Caldilineaceae bacterium]